MKNIENFYRYCIFLYVAEIWQYTPKKTTWQVYGLRPLIHMRQCLLVLIHAKEQRRPGPRQHTLLGSMGGLSKQS